MTERKLSVFEKEFQGVAVMGPVDRSYADLARALRVLVEEEQTKPLPNNALVAALLDCARMGTEFAHNWSMQFLLAMSGKVPGGTFQTEAAEARDDGRTQVIASRPGIGGRHTIKFSLGPAGSRVQWRMDVNVAVEEFGFIPDAATGEEPVRWEAQP